MKNICMIGVLTAALLAACGPKPRAGQANTPKAVAAAEIPALAQPAQPVRAAIPTGVAPQPAPATPGVNPVMIPENPNDLAEIQKRFLQTIEAAIKKAEPGLKTPVTRIIGNQTHSFFAEYAGRYVYDIKKTDSIVSPLLGMVSWSVNWYDNGMATNIPTTLDARYAYQNGQWVMRDLVRRVNDEKNFPADEYLPFFQ